MRQLSADHMGLGEPSLNALPTDVLSVVFSKLDLVSLCCLSGVSRRLQGEVKRALPEIIFERPVPVREITAVINSGHFLGGTICQIIKSAAPETLSRLFASASHVEKIALITTVAHLHENVVQELLDRVLELDRPFFNFECPALLIDPNAVHLSTEDDLGLYYVILTCFIERFFLRN